ncbi:hypothetical protein AB0878_36310 [Amycolatopsis sp. NPDC047767]|uniref:hypothetical protein n=1 Tax=Amycolatopsis sp. NPDC047767 TaxID=3156765 RepID=UPI003455B0ED
MTPKARDFLNFWGKRILRPVPVISFDAPDYVRDAVLSQEQEFGGISFPVQGGELQGWIRLGVKSGKPWRTSADEWIFNFAEPQFVQCGLVCRVDGYFGVSWSGEFLPWHADVCRLIESSAIWADLIGWRKSALCDGIPRDVLNTLSDLNGLSEAESASSREASWWLGDDTAVYIEPHLTYFPGGSSRIHVMTSDAEVDQRVKRELEAAGKAGTDLLVRLQEGLVATPEECPFS